MKKLITILIISGAISQIGNAQINVQDSLFLVDLYDQTGGQNWNNNTGWKSNNPASTWFGVLVTNNRLRGIFLNNNNLTGQVPGSINNAVLLDTFSIRNNGVLELPLLNLQNLDNLDHVEVQNNKLTFEDLEPNVPLIQSNEVTFIFSPQDSIGVPGVVHDKGVGHEHDFVVTTGGTQNQYQWFLNGTSISGATDSLLQLTDLMQSDTGFYNCQITSSIVEFSGFSLNTFQEDMNVEWCTDAFGGKYICDEMIIQFDSTATSSDKDSLRLEFGAEVTDSCMCGVIEVWDLADTVTLEDENGQEGQVALAKMKTKIEDAGLNYATFLTKDSPLTFTLPTGVIDGNNSNDPNKVTVAVIDSGIDYDHPDLTDFIWINNGELPVSSVGDDDGNCLIDDYMGYNFLNENKFPYDFNGHGTHVAGIIKSGLTTDKVELMNLKFADKNGQGLLFDAACAVYYAIDKQADLINASWGYVGKPSSILYTAIEEAGRDCGILFVTSAGNDTLNINLAGNPHYPSNYDLDNVITIGNYDSGASALAADSNFGLMQVDMAAEGVSVNSTIPNNTYGVKSGTSMAAAKVTNAAVQMLYQKTTASFRGLKHSLLTEATYDAALVGKIFSEGILDVTDAVNYVDTFPLASECDALLSLKIFMEGPYDSGSGTMYDSLRSQSLIPTVQPFNTAPWNYAGTDTVSNAVLTMTGSDAVVDWILVRVTDPNDNSNQVTKPALVQRDGDVIDGEGNFLSFESQQKNGIYSIVHRNHLGVQTQSEIALPYLPTVIDFTNPSFPTLGGSAQNIIGGVRAMWGGDANSDGKVNVVDKNLYWVFQNGSSGSYSNTSDFDLDGTVDPDDKNLIWLVNISKQSKCPNCY